MIQKVSANFVDLVQGWCGEDDLAWRGKTTTADGSLYVWIEADNTKDNNQSPESFQLALLEYAWQKHMVLKQEAVAYVHQRVIRNPDEFGLVDEGGHVLHDLEIDWMAASLDDYRNDFKLRQIGIPTQRLEEDIIYLAFETNLDLEHGVVVEMVDGEPTRDGMCADFGEMLILESEAY